jgi:hypothetical protein
VRCDGLLTAVFAFVLPASLLQAAPLTYTLTDLGPASEFNQGQVNNQGQVIFSSGNSSIFYNGTRQLIPNPLGATFTANGLNNLGQVVGQVNYPNFTYAIGFYAGGAVQVINGSASMTGDVINDAGQIAGTLVNSYRAFLYAGGTFTTINPLAGDGETTPRGINQAGDVLVYSTGTSGHVAIYSQGVLTMVPGSAGLDIQPEGINNADQVVGYASDNTHRLSEGVVLSHGQATFLGASPGAESFANAINDAGVIVGDEETPTGFFATVYDSGTGWVNLNSVVTNGSGWSLEFAHSINSEGQIAGIGRHNGVPSAYLLTPIPEPSTLALFGVALLGLGAWVRRHPSVFR